MPTDIAPILRALAWLVAIALGLIGLGTGVALKSAKGGAPVISYLIVIAFIVGCIAGFIYLLRFLREGGFTTPIKNPLIKEKPKNPRDMDCAT